MCPRGVTKKFPGDRFDRAKAAFECFVLKLPIVDHFLLNSRKEKHELTQVERDLKQLTLVW